MGGRLTNTPTLDSTSVPADGAPDGEHAHQPTPEVACEGDGDIVAAWTACAASIRGTSHERLNLPCQDAHALRLVSVQDGEVLVAIVSDGAGSAKRGEDGSRFICDELADALAEVLSAEELGAASLNLGEVVANVRLRLLEHADTQGAPAREFACTLLCAVLGPEWATFAQIGDGVIVTPGDEEWMWAFWPQRGEYANTTSFITDRDAMVQLQVDVAATRVDEIAMLSDGLQHLVLHYETQAVHSPFFEKMMTPVRTSEAGGVDEALNGALRSYLSSKAVAERADDDLTLLLASRRDRKR